MQPGTIQHIFPGTPPPRHWMTCFMNRQGIENTLPSRIRSKDGQYVHCPRSSMPCGDADMTSSLSDRIIETDAFSQNGFAATTTIPPWFYEIMESAYGVIALMRPSGVFKHRPDAIYERYTLFLPESAAYLLTGRPFFLRSMAPRWNAMNMTA